MYSGVVVTLRNRAFVTHPEEIAVSPVLLCETLTILSYHVQVYYKGIINVNKYITYGFLQSSIQRFREELIGLIT